MKVHKLKCNPEPFQDLLEGLKSAEVRREDDRVFSFGDVLILVEAEVAYGEWASGRIIKAHIMHVQRGYGLPPGLAVLSVQSVKRYLYKPRLMADMILAEY